MSKSSFLFPLLLGALALPACDSKPKPSGDAPASATEGKQQQLEAVEILNVSYDPTRELYEQYNKAFSAHWKKTKGQDVTVRQSHGGGGKAMKDLIDDVFVRAFDNPLLAPLEAQARINLAALSALGDRLTFTTDSFVVDPLFFPGGDIGKLADCGTVNDIAVGGAIPLHLSCAVIVEEGVTIELLKRVADSMARTAVVPTPMMRRPAARASFTSRAVVSGTENRSGYGFSCASGDATPVCSRIGANTMPRDTRRVTSSSVNGRLALGISALPGAVAKTVR